MANHVKNWSKLQASDVDVYFSSNQHFTSCPLPRQILLTLITRSLFLITEAPSCSLSKLKNKQTHPFVNVSSILKWKKNWPTNPYSWSFPQISLFETRKSEQNCKYKDLINSWSMLFTLSSFPLILVLLLMLCHDTHILVTSDKIHFSYSYHPS